MMTKTCPSDSFWKQRKIPAGKMKIIIWRSKKNDGQAVGWCSETEAMMGTARSRMISSKRPAGLKGSTETHCGSWRSPCPTDCRIVRSREQSSASW